MKQPYELAIAARYLRARRRESFISFISLVSMIGIGLAVAVLIVVTSVMDGFEYELQRRILGVASHASVYAADGRLELWREMREGALERGLVLGAAPFVEGQGMAIAWDAESPAGVEAGSDGANHGARADAGSGASDGGSAETGSGASDGDSAEPSAGANDGALAAPGDGTAARSRTGGGESPRAASASSARAGNAAAMRTTGLLIRGIDPELEPTVSDLGELMRAGSLSELEPGSYRIIIGAGAAETLGVDVGGRIVLALAQNPLVTAVGVRPRMRSFTVAGIFDAGMYEYDQGLALVHIEDGAKLFRTGGEPSGLRVAVEDVYAAPVIAIDVARTAGERTYPTDWTGEHVSFFASIRLSKSIMFVILSMVVAVAAFNIVSTLVMVVRDKRGDIAILRSFGAPPASILKIFASQGTLIGLVGTLFGLLLGLLVTTQLQNVVELIEAALDVDLLSAEVYWLGELPSRLRLGEIARICGLALLLAIAATIYPAFAAARQPPAEALRYE